MKHLILILFVFALASSGAAQVKCEMTVDESPGLLDLKLGMTVADVNSKIGRDLKVKVKPKGERTFLKNYVKKLAKGSLSGVRSIFLSFYDGRLYQIEIFYREDHRWADLESLLEDYSTENGFPHEFWISKHGYAKARCDGFSIDADRILNPHIQITEDSITELVEQERAKK